uniref:Uncharacterized protein n=2 Tax=Quercus lobata TaxID=97700 RepID=A0A7N2RB32_QUELO
MFESSRQQFSIGGGGLGLISVPDHLRKLDEQAFTPLLLSIGPIHLSNVKLQSTKRYKVQFCESFLRWTKMDLKDLVGCVRSCEKEIRSYYAENILSDISSDDFVAMILVDAMFILGYFYKQSYLTSELDGMIPDWMHPFLKLDMVLLENQLPFSVLEMLFNQATSSAELKTEALLELALEFFQCYNFQKMSLENIAARIENFTDLVRLFHLNVSQLRNRISGGAKLPYSATQLHEAGVKFKGVKFEVATKRYGGDRCFLDLRFDLKNGVLEIPCITLNAEKIRLIRNISALEQSLYVGHAYVTDFFVILDFLIDTSKDVDLLCKEGILVNYLGDSNAAASAINNLNTNILWDYMNPNYSKICEDLNVFYKKPWHKWRATLWRQYFSTPWRAASTSAAIILLLLTLAQTVCSLKSTIW